MDDSSAGRSNQSSQERVKGLEERAIGIDDSEQDWGGM